MDPGQRLHDDFHAFLALIWRHLGLPRPTPVQRDIAAFLQEPGRRKVVQAFRGVGKSWITSVYVLWLLYRDPDTKVLVVSASKDRADAFSIFTKRLLNDVPFLQHLRPDPTQGDRDSNVAFDVRPAGAAHAPSVRSIGITGQITGARADYVVADDVEVVNNSESVLQREKLSLRVAELGGAVLTPKARAGESGGVVFLGTPQVEDSLYAKLPDAGYVTRIWPAEVPTDPGRYLGHLAPHVETLGPAGTPVDPHRFDVFELGERKAEYGRSGYQLQFMLDTSLTDEDKHPLKTSDLIVFDTKVDIAPHKLAWGSGPDQVIEALPLVGLPGDRWHRPIFIDKDWAPYNSTLMYVDPSGRGKDQTAYAVVKELHGMLFLRKWEGTSGGYDEEVLTHLARVARDEEVNTVVIEDNFGDGMYAELFRPILRRIHKAGCTVEDDHVTGQKERRALAALEPLLVQHRLIVDTEVVRSNTRDKRTADDPEAAIKTGFYQLTRLTADRGCLKFDDYIDCLSGAVRWFVERMRQDIDQAAKEQEDAALDEELEKIIDHWEGRSGRTRKTWGGDILVRG